jgi:hypothetical protein
LSTHNCQVPTPTPQTLEIEQQIRIFGITKPRIANVSMLEFMQEEQTPDNQTTILKIKAYGWFLRLNDVFDATFGSLSPFDITGNMADFQSSKRRIGEGT